MNIVILLHTMGLVHSQLNTIVIYFLNLYRLKSTKKSSNIHPALENIDILKESVTFINGFDDFESDNLKIEFDFKASGIDGELFDYDEMKFIVDALRHRKMKKILTEPIVAAYLHLKWNSFKGFFYAHWLFFILGLLIPLTLLTSLMVEMNSCIIGSKFFTFLDSLFQLWLPL